MKITTTEKEPQLFTFNKLRPGDVFRYNKFVCLKLDEVLCEQDDDEQLYNAIELEDGVPIYIDYYFDVTPLDAELSIRE